MQEQQRRRLARKARLQERRDDPDVLAPLIDQVPQQSSAQGTTEAQGRSPRRTLPPSPQLAVWNGVGGGNVQVAGWLAEARCAVAYTGAGLSAAAGIPTYRGLGGVYTAHAADAPAINYLQCQPTAAHMALATLAEQGTLAHIVSQNVDALHRRSGVSPHHLSEIHGNGCIEYCPACLAASNQRSVVVRRFDVTANTARHRHVTARRCGSCRSQLHDTIVHYGEAAR
jgi:NAD-dependent deacetylase sirtuin 7